MLRTFVTFRSTEPDAGQWDEFGNLLVPGGKRTCQSLRDALLRRGYRCSDVAQHLFYGWSFDVAGTQGSAWCLLQAGDAGPESWLLTIEDARGVLPRLLGRTGPAALEDIATTVSESLGQDGRFSNTLWYTRLEYEQRRLGRSAGRPRVEWRNMNRKC